MENNRVVSLIRVMTFRSLSLSHYSRHDAVCFLVNPRWWDIPLMTSDARGLSMTSHIPLMLSERYMANYDVTHSIDDVRRQRVFSTRLWLVDSVTWSSGYISPPHWIWSVWFRPPWWKDGFCACAGSSWNPRWRIWRHTFHWWRQTLEGVLYTSA